MSYEYKVVPAPKRGLKAKGVRSSEDRFANALQTVMNAHGAEGWEYQRTDTLPCDERSGLTGRSTTFQNMLVFRRALPQEAAEQTPEVQPAQERITETLAVEGPSTPPLLEAKPLDADPARPEPQVAAE